MRCLLPLLAALALALAPCHIQAARTLKDADQQCLDEFTAWWQGCTDLSTCCPLLKLLGAPCLAHVLTQTAEGKRPEVEKVYSKCGVKLPAAGGTGGPSQECLSTYGAAVKGSCGAASTREACCTALIGVGPSCLQGVMDDMAADPASVAKLGQLKSYLDRCTEKPAPDFDPPAGPSPGRGCEPGAIALYAVGNGMVGQCLSSEKELKQCCGVLKRQSDACFKQYIQETREAAAPSTEQWLDNLFDMMKACGIAVPEDDEPGAEEPRPPLVD